MNLFINRCKCRNSNGTSGSMPSLASDNYKKCMFHTVSVWEELLFIVFFLIIFFIFDC